MGYNVLSLFDGISCGHLALDKAGIPIDKYYAVEIDDLAQKVTNHNFKNTKRVCNDVRLLVKEMINNPIDLLIGGSPCQSFSFAGKRKGMITKENIEITTFEKYIELKNTGFEFEGQSYLFWEFIRIYKEFKPKYFLLENVRMNKKWENIISNVIGVKPISINSAKVSAQNRERLYWTNIPNISQPEDRNIKLSDIIPHAQGCGNRGRWDENLQKYVQYFTIRKDYKSNCVVTTVGPTQQIILDDSVNSNSINQIKKLKKSGMVRSLTVEEAETLQLIPRGFTNVPGIKKEDRYKMVGNAWTIGVIEHIFKNIPEFKS